MCRHRKRTFDRGLKLFLNVDDIEKLRDFEEECVHEYLTTKEEREKGTVEEKMSFTADKVSNMLTRVDTIKQNETQQNSHLQSFDERLQRLEDMHTSIMTLVQTLVQNLSQQQQSPSSALPLHILQSSLISQHISPQQSTNNDLKFDSVSSSSLSLHEVKGDQTALVEKSQKLSCHHPVQGRSFSLATPHLDRGVQTDILSASHSCNFNKTPSFSPLAPVVIITGQHDEVINTVRNPLFSPLDKTTLMIQHSSPHQDEQKQEEKLHEAEETEHNIIGQLIKQRVRTLSTAVEEIERTLERVPGHNNVEMITETSSNNTDDYLGEEVLLASIIDWTETSIEMVIPSQNNSQEQGDNDFALTPINNSGHVLNIQHLEVDAVFLPSPPTQQQNNTASPPI
ncbi:unnamed protein product [Didymodactylos carnosus]|nr:unnamed protein product [Didymodactylos carnosus]CAF4136426.1 unnamed protein product [Didymodactylos carnosus]